MNKNPKNDAIVKEILLASLDEMPVYVIYNEIRINTLISTDIFIEIVNSLRQQGTIELWRKDVIINRDLNKNDMVFGDNYTQIVKTPCTMQALINMKKNSKM